MSASSECPPLLSLTVPTPSLTHGPRDVGCMGRRSRPRDISAFAINSLILFYLKGREIAHLYAGSFPIWLQPRPYLGPNQAKLRSQELSPSFPHRMAEIQVFSHSPLP